MSVTDRRGRFAPVERRGGTRPEGWRLSSGLHGRPTGGYRAGGNRRRFDITPVRRSQPCGRGPLSFQPVLCMIDGGHQILVTNLPPLSCLCRMSRPNGGDPMLISQHPDGFSDADDESRETWVWFKHVGPTRSQDFQRASLDKARNLRSL